MKQPSLLDNVKLKAIIAQSGLKKNFIARKMGISAQQFYKKMRKDASFSGSQINILRELLHLDDSQTLDIFFSQSVSKLETTSKIRNHKPRRELDS